MVRIYGTAAILLTLLATQRNVAIANDTVRLTPDQVYWRAQAAVDRLTQPAYVAFTFENQGIALDGLSLNPHKTPYPSRELLRVVVRTSDGRAAVCAFKDQRGRDIAHPSVGIVTDPIGWTVLTNISRLGDFPTADFGLRNGTSSRNAFFEAAAPSPRASSLHVIARVVAFEPPPYRIVDLGDTSIGDRTVYHLGLEPIRNPAYNVLRQIWIDKTTFLPVRYVAIRTVLDVPEPFSYAVTVDSTEIDGHLVNIDANGVSVDGLGKWRIFQISFPDAEPDWVFDPDLWPRHNGEQIPYLAASLSAPR